MGKQEPSPATPQPIVSLAKFSQQWLANQNPGTCCVQAHYREERPLNIELSEDRRKLLLREIQVHFSARHDEEIGEFKAALLLDFFIAHLGPPVYNQAIKDALGFMQEKLVDLEAEFYAVEKR